MLVMFATKGYRRRPETEKQRAASAVRIQALNACSEVPAGLDCGSHL